MGKYFTAPGKIRLDMIFRRCQPSPPQGCNTTDP